MQLIVDYLRDAVHQLTFISSMLGVVSFAVVMYVMQNRMANRIANTSIALLNSAAICFLGLTVVGLVLGWVIPTIPDLYPGQAAISKASEVGYVIRLLLCVFVLALATCMSGLALSGWLHSRVVGWLSTISVASVTLGVAGAYFYITQGIFG